MVVESWESDQNIPLFTCTKTFTAELMDICGLLDLNEKKVEELLYLLIFVLEVKDNLDKTEKNCMHWNVALDALPGSATFVRVMDRWLND